MAGQRHHKDRPTERIHRAYREPIEDMASEYGFDPEWLSTHFEWLTCCRQYEQGMGRNLAAWCAWRDLQSAFLKHGNQEPD